MHSSDNGKLGAMDWATLLERIQDGKCTPFLGAGANFGLLPLGGEIAESWAREYEYPTENHVTLELVSQFLAVHSGDAMLPKERMIKLLRSQVDKMIPANLDSILSAPDNPLSVLADLPLPVYITTNYDDLLIKALAKRGKKPQREICRWNGFVKGRPSIFQHSTGYEPTPASPVVFYLHGCQEVVESLVLTEDDYLDFLVSISRQRLLPPRIEEAMTGASLLFLGYRLADMSFRVIFRGLVGALEGSLRRINLSVQLPHDSDAARLYMTKYFDASHVRVFWGTAQTFAQELRHRWNDFKARNE